MDVMIALICELMVKRVVDIDIFRGEVAVKSSERPTRNLACGRNDVEMSLSSSDFHIANIRVRTL